MMGLAAFFTSFLTKTCEVEVRLSGTYDGQGEAKAVGVGSNEINLEFRDAAMSLGSG